MDTLRETAQEHTSEDALHKAKEVAVSAKTANGAAADDAPTISIAQETVKRSADALFMLWLKIGATLLALRLMELLSPVLILLVLALMLVATFNPIVRRLQKRYKRSSAIAIVVTGIMLGMVALMGLIIPPLVRQSTDLINNFPSYMAQLETGAKQMGVPIKVIRNMQVSPQISNMGPQAMTMLTSVFSGVTGALTVLVLTIYLLVDGQQVASGALGLLPRQMRLPMRKMFGEIGVQVGDYVRGQLITSGLAGLFSYLVLLALGVNEPLALGFLMAVSDIIPIVGPLIGTIPAVLMALTKSPTTALIVVVAYILYHQVESHILVPRIYGKTMKLAPSIIVISILIGATLMGILGALLALPVAAAVPVVFRYIQEWRQRQDEQNNGAERVLP